MNSRSSSVHQRRRHRAVEEARCDTIQACDVPVIAICNGYKTKHVRNPDAQRSVRIL